jgi:hypothetical protein
LLVPAKGDGQAMVETANGVGTGAYTVIAQTAARKLRFDLSGIGDSRLPPGPLAGAPAPGWVSKLAGEGLWRKRHTLWRICVAPNLTALIMVNQRCDGFGPRQQYFDTQTVFAIPVAPNAKAILRKTIAPGG